MLNAPQADRPRRHAWPLAALAVPRCTAISFVIANAPALVRPLSAHGRYRVRPGQAPAARRVRAARRAVPEPDGQERAARPVVIFWYGGSWDSGSRNRRIASSARRSRSAGFVTVLPDYRLYPKVKFPVFLDDARARRSRGCSSMPQEFGGDPRHIVLMGHSAGAHTAAYLALNREFLAKRGREARVDRGARRAFRALCARAEHARAEPIFGKPCASRTGSPCAS